MRLMQEENGREVTSLQQKLHEAESDVNTLERQLQTSSLGSSNHRDSPVSKEMVTEVMSDPRRTERPIVEVRVMFNKLCLVIPVQFQINQNGYCG